MSCQLGAWEAHSHVFVAIVLAGYVCSYREKRGSPHLGKIWVSNVLLFLKPNC